jgi:hypothetical protein
VIVNNERTTVSAAGVDVEIENTSEKQKIAILEIDAVIIKRPHGGGSGGSWI